MTMRHFQTRHTLLPLNKNTFPQTTVENSFTTRVMKVRGHTMSERLDLDRRKAGPAPPFCGADPAVLGPSCNDIWA